MFLFGKFRSENNQTSARCYQQANSLEKEKRLRVCDVCVYLCMVWLVQSPLLQACAVVINSLRPRQNGRLSADDTFKRIFLNENIRISTKNSLKFLPKGLINNIPALVLIMAWCRPGDNPLSESMLVRSLTQICVTRRQWVNAVIETGDKVSLYRTLLKQLCHVQCEFGIFRKSTEHLSGWCHRKWITFQLILSYHLNIH